MTAQQPSARPEFQWKTGPIRPKRAMILAAGLGKRMRPVTATTPVVNVHYLGQLVRVHVARRTAPEVIISDETAQLLDTGGGIAHALPHLGSEPFYLLNSDSFWIEGPRPNLEWLAAAWRDDAMDGLLMLSSTVRAIGYSGRGDFRMEPDGRLKRRPEREVAPFAYSGAAILHPRLFADCPPGPFSLNLLFDRALEAGRLFGVRMDGQWLHVGTPEAIGEAELSVADSAA
jgi:MurNAc alpha-1-phosphate uridylyltransferase